MILDRVFGQRMDQHVEPLAVEHQKRHNMLELGGLEDDQHIGDRVGANRPVAETVELDTEFSPTAAHTRSAIGRVLPGRNRCARDSRGSRRAGSAEPLMRQPPGRARAQSRKAGLSHKPAPAGIPGLKISRNLPFRPAKS